MVTWKAASPEAFIHPTIISTLLNAILSRVLVQDFVAGELLHQMLDLPVQMFSLRGCTSLAVRALHHPLEQWDILVALSVVEARQFAYNPFRLSCVHDKQSYCRSSIALHDISKGVLCRKEIRVYLWETARLPILRLTLLRYNPPKFAVFERLLRILFVLVSFLLCATSNSGQGELEIVVSHLVCLLSDTTLEERTQRRYTTYWILTLRRFGEIGYSAIEIAAWCIEGGIVKAFTVSEAVAEGEVETRQQTRRWRSNDHRSPTRESGNCPLSFTPVKGSHR